MHKVRLLVTLKMPRSGFRCTLRIDIFPDIQDLWYDETMGIFSAFLDIDIVHLRHIVEQWGYESSSTFLPFLQFLFEMSCN
jgi:hypothetical protein